MRVEGLVPVCIRQVKGSEKVGEHFQVNGQDVDKVGAMHRVTAWAALRTGCHHHPALEALTGSSS